MGLEIAILPEKGSETSGVCLCEWTRMSALANVTRISQHVQRRALCHVFFGGVGGERWLDSSVILAGISWMCHCKRNKVYLKRTRRHGSSGLVPCLSEQGSESSLRDNHSFQNTTLNWSYNKCLLTSVFSQKNILLHSALCSAPSWIISPFKFSPGCKKAAAEVNIWHFNPPKYLTKVLNVSHVSSAGNGSHGTS